MRKSNVKQICEVYRGDDIGESPVRRWFAKFKAGNFDLENEDYVGRHSIVCDDLIKAQIDSLTQYLRSEKR